MTGYLAFEGFFGTWGYEVLGLGRSAQGYENLIYSIL
jgi:hypothetical protein